LKRAIGLLLAALLLVACGNSAPPPRAGAADSSLGFRSPERLEEHYEKHGAEFGNIGKAEYLRRARELRDESVGGPVLQYVREDGVITKFDRRTGSFGAYDPDGTIRTFFIPNDGERYFRRQARRYDGR